MDKYKSKPTPEFLAQYINRLEYFLSAHHLTVSVVLQDRALSMNHTKNGQYMGTTSFWMDRVEVSTPTIKNLKLDWYGWGIEEDMADREIWEHAWHLQHALYQKLGLNPKDINDPFYGLWEKYQEINKVD